MSLDARHSALVIMLLGARKLLQAVESDDLEELRRAVLVMKSITAWASAIEVAGDYLPVARKLLGLDLASQGVTMPNIDPKFCERCGMSITVNEVCKGCVFA